MAEVIDMLICNCLILSFIINVEG